MSVAYGYSWDEPRWWLGVLQAARGQS